MIVDITREEVFDHEARYVMTERCCPECGREAEFIRPISLWPKEGAISRYWHVAASECDVVLWDDDGYIYRDWQSQQNKQTQKEKNKTMTTELVAPELDPFEYINLTPHDVVVRWDGGERVFPASGQVLRLQDTVRDVEPEEGDENTFSVPMVYVSVGEATELPREDIDARKIYIVSRVAASALAGTRDDIVFPFGEIRNSAGQIIAVRALAYMDSF